MKIFLFKATRETSFLKKFFVLKLLCTKILQACLRYDNEILLELNLKLCINPFFFFFYLFLVLFFVVFFYLVFFLKDSRITGL